MASAFHEDDSSDEDEGSNVEISKDVDMYFDLKMCKDKKTEMYVKFAKVMIINQGPYSPGKFSYIAEKFRSASRVLSDESFSKEVQVKFSPNPPDSKDYYDYFQNQAKDALEEGNNLLVINTSMSSQLQNLFYISLAQKMQYVVLVVPPIINIVRQIPPKHTFAFSLFKEWGQVMPCSNMFQHLFCGWFLHDVDSHELRNEAALYAQDCMDEVPDFKKLFENKIQYYKKKLCAAADASCTSEVKATESLIEREPSLLDVFKDYYNLDDKWQDNAYCAVKVFTNFYASPSEYFKKEIVKQNYGKMSKLIIVGFIITPDIIAARVKLTYHQRDLWEMADELDEAIPDENIPSGPSSLMQGLKSELSESNARLISSKSNRTLITGKPPDGPIHHRCKGRACHIILGKRQTAKSRNIDYDVQFGLRRYKLSDEEERESNTYELRNCKIIREKKYWFINLEQSLIIDGFFSSYCKPHSFEEAIHNSTNS